MLCPTLNLLNLNVEKIAEQIEAFKARRRELEPQLENVKEELKDIYGLRNE